MNIEKLVVEIQENITELESYLVSNDYNDLEKHDCIVCIDVYRQVLKLIENTKK